MADLAELARRTLGSVRYMALGTVDPSGRPRVSPVWFSLVGYRDVYWLSSPDAHHSRNIEERPEVSIVVFDSQADPHTGQAVYLEATAGRVPEEELGGACAAAFEGVDDELSFTPETLRVEPSCSTGRTSPRPRSTSEDATSVTVPDRTGACLSRSEIGAHTPTDLLGGDRQ